MCCDRNPPVPLLLCLGLAALLAVAPTAAGAGVRGIPIHAGDAVDVEGENFVEGDGLLVLFGDVPAPFAE